MPLSLALTGHQHEILRQHLFPGDGCEAVAIALCGKQKGADRQGLLVREIIPIPYAECSRRTPVQVVWSTTSLPALLERAERNRLAIVKVHSHPGHYPQFSEVDDQADRALFPSIYAWLDDEGPHGSAVMLPDGVIFGRVVSDTGAFQPLDQVRLVGDDLHFWFSGSRHEALPDYAKRIAQTFGEATYSQLRRLRIGVVGCSGTGSLVIEQLARDCVGELVLVDFERIEAKNLNRIPQAFMADAVNELYKVDVMKRAIEAMGFGTRVITYPTSLFTPAAIRALATCDVIFGCMDTIDGRHALNKLATFYLLPYFDVGVKLVANGAGGIETVVGTVHYLQPGGSSLLSRGVYSLSRLEAATLLRQNPQEYALRRKAGYIEGVDEERPAVISVNMLYAGLAVNEFLARLHPYRMQPNAAYAVHRFSFSHGIYCPEDDGAPCPLLSRHVGRGDVVPLLDSPELSEEFVV